MSTKPPPLTAGTVAVIVCGNVLEWYDFAAYGYFVTLIASQFFPEQDRVAGLLAAFGVFALGFLGRVGGGLLYGLLSDRAGRGRALQLSVVLMATSTTLMGLLPTHATIGTLAPILLTLLRLLQGLSVGGEFATSITMLAERAPRERRGLVSGLVGAAACLGFVMGAGVGALLSWQLSTAQLQSWGWRVPFLSGALLGVMAYVLRRRLLALGESEPRQERQEQQSAGEILKQVLVTQRTGVLRATAGIVLYMVGFYVPFVYLATGLQSRGLLGMSSSLSITTGALLVLALLSPPAGWLADRVGARRLLIVCAVLLAGAALPLFTLMQGGNLWVIILCMLGLVVLYAPFNAVATLPLALQFPPAVRGTAFSIGFNLAATLCGGLSPLVADIVVRRAGNLGAAGALLVVAAIPSIWAWARCPDEAMAGEAARP